MFSFLGNDQHQDNHSVLQVNNFDINNRKLGVKVETKKQGNIGHQLLAVIIRTSSN